MAIIDITKPMALDETLQGTNTKMDAVILKLQGIIDALGLDTSVYKPKGNIACAQLVPALLIESNIGNVYNVTDNGTTTSDFVEGAGKPIHVGDNVAIVDIGTGGQSEYKFDLLAGMVDLTNYVQKSATPGLLKNDGTVDTKDYAEKVSGATNGNLAGLNGSGNLTDSGWNGAKDTTSISGNPISISGLKANQLAKDPIITLEPIQAGSGTPSPSNIRAISGYDKIEVLSCGKNLFDVSKMMVGMYDQDNWHMNDNTLYRSYRLRLKAGTYVFSSSEQLQMVRKVVNGVLSTISGYTSYVLTVDSDAEIGLSFQRPSSQAWGTTPNIQLEENNQATTYVPYNKTTDLSESLGQTVYGGTLDVRTGKFTVTHKIIDLGDVTWTYDTTYVRFKAIGALPDANAYWTMVNWYCSCFEAASSAYADADRTYGVITLNQVSIFVRDNRYTDAADFTTAVTGQKLVYPLATPFTIQLTPHEISILKDYAYVSTNGTNIALDYHNGELASLGDVSQLGETVNEGLDYLKGYVEKNVAGNYVTLTETKYEFPCDGYVVVASETSTSGTIRAVVQDKNNTNVAFLYMNVTGSYQMQSVFVRKGLVAKVIYNTVSAGWVRFIPLP